MFIHQDKLNRWRLRTQSMSVGQGCRFDPPVQPAPCVNDWETFCVLLKMDIFVFICTMRITCRWRWRDYRVHCSTLNCLTLFKPHDTEDVCVCVFGVCVCVCVCVNICRMMSVWGGRKKTVWRRWSEPTAATSLQMVQSTCQFEFGNSNVKLEFVELKGTKPNNEEVWGKQVLYLLFTALQYSLVVLILRLTIPHYLPVLCYN